MHVEQGEVKIQFSGKMLVEDGLRHAGPLRYVIHRGRVVALGDKDLLSRLEQLLASSRPGQSGRPARGVRPAYRGHRFTSWSSTCWSSTWSSTSRCDRPL